MTYFARFAQFIKECDFIDDCRAFIWGYFDFFFIYLIY